MKWNNKRRANILLIAVILNVAGLIVMFFQTQYVLTSPLIPKATIVDIVAPYLFNALIYSVANIAALLFYFYAKYIVTIIIYAVTITIPTTFYYLFFHPDLYFPCTIEHK